jgi:hypothetical protein
MSAGIDRTKSRTSAVNPPGAVGAYQRSDVVASNTVRGQAGTGAWTPTVTHLFVLIILEIAAFAALRYAFGQLSKSI